ncbi:hypothetical protein PR048_001355 [Dryococelus australis]|uniref:Uncharacterized protein n=1 Tax=Dryococelus australis TaxID=614101 RepID=A0ABQ9IH40_9NEOP|nr:hypothetical protein PR048_001355 [Dryococelus australis]
MKSKKPEFYFWTEDQARRGSTEVSATIYLTTYPFLPADSVFGRVEKLLWKRPLTTTEREYEEIYSEVGNVHALRKDWKLHDVKSLSNVFQNVHGTCECKRIIIEKD